MKLYIVLISVLVILTSGSVVSCTEQGKSEKQNVIEFAQTIEALERDRDGLIVEYQEFSRNFMDMRTVDVFEKAEYFVITHTELRNLLLEIDKPTKECKEVHSKFVLAYAAESKAYVVYRSFLHTIDEEKLYEAMELFSKADIFFMEAYRAMDDLLARYGSSWSLTLR